jgi:SAM-dependent methyltransferase
MPPAGSSEMQAPIWNTVAAQRARTFRRALIPLWHGMLDAVRLQAGTRLLDAGCGSGEAAALALERGAKVWGFDCSEEMLACARTNAPHATLARGDLEAAPYPDDQFEAITACNTVHFAAAPLRALLELKRVARPGARIALVSMGTSEDLHIRRIVFDPVFAMVDAPPTNPLIYSGPGALERLLAEAGLEIDTTIKVLTVWPFDTFDEAWETWRCIGPVAAIMKQLGEEAVKATVRERADQLAREGQGYVLRDWWRVVTVVVE